MAVVIYDFSTLISTEFYSAAVHHQLFACLTSQNEFNGLIMQTVLQHRPLNLMILDLDVQYVSVDVQYVGMCYMLYRLVWFVMYLWINNAVC